MTTTPQACVDLTKRLIPFHHTWHPATMDVLGVRAWSISLAVVLSGAEVHSRLGHLDGKPELGASLLHGSGVQCKDGMCSVRSRLLTSG